MGTLTKTEDNREVEFDVADSPLVVVGRARRSLRVERIKIRVLWDDSEDTSSAPETFVNVIVRRYKADGTPRERTTFAEEFYSWEDHPEIVALVDQACEAAGVER